MDGLHSVKGSIIFKKRKKRKKRSSDAVEFSETSSDRFQDFYLGVNNDGAMNFLRSVPRFLFLGVNNDGAMNLLTGKV